MPIKDSMRLLLSEDSSREAGDVVWCKAMELFYTAMLFSLFSKSKFRMELISGMSFIIDDSVFLFEIDHLTPNFRCFRRGHPFSLVLKEILLKSIGRVI